MAILQMFVFYLSFGIITLGLVIGAQISVRQRSKVRKISMIGE